MSPEKVVVAFWLVFVVYWMVSARKFKERSNQKRTLWDWSGVAIAAVIGVLSRSRYLQYRLTRQDAVTEGVAFILCAAGIAFAIWGRRLLGANWSTSPSVREGHQLITSGPYGWVRHPIYTGVLIALLGTALVSTILWWIVFAASCLIFLYRVHAEEKLMVTQFPEQYPEYKKRTKALIPLIW
jgi:protein-S-isoprenylcysteine O-methyltransferase